MVLRGAVVYGRLKFWSILIAVYPMKTLSLAETKTKVSALVDQVHNSDEEVVITKNGRPVAVLVSSLEPRKARSWLI